MKQQKECACCGYACEKEDMYLIDDEYYCLDCVGICDNCGSIELYDELTIVNYGRDDQRYVCSECLNTDSFFQCRSCNEYYTSNSYWGSYLGSPICEHCSENYEVCEQCDNVFPAGELEYCSRTDEYLCIDCIRDADCSIENIVNEYSYKPSPLFFGDSQDEQDLHIAKLILLISKFYDSHILKFSRRKEHELSWCANPELNYESHDTEATIVDKMKCCKSKGRYQAALFHPMESYRLSLPNDYQD